MPSLVRQPLPRLLRAGLDLLVVVLLALAAGRALADRADGGAAVVAVAAVLGAGWLAGSWLPRAPRGPRAVVAWLGAETGLWLALLALTPDGVWLAFPLFVVQLYLLPARWGLAAVAATTGAAVVGFAAHQAAFTLAAAVGPIVGAAVTVAGVLGYRALEQESARRERLIEQLDATREQLAVAGHAAGVAAERERLAREIHDTLAQGLSSIQLLLRAAEHALPDGPEAAAAAGYVEQARDIARDNLAEARRFVRALSPPDLERASLPAALQRLCERTAQRRALTVDFHVSGTPAPVPTPYEVALLRVAQSALANTLQHAGATRATLTLTYMDARIALDAVDDGAGFDVAAARGRSGSTSGFGLAAMFARARDLGGELSVESAPGRGTALAVSFPRWPAADDAVSA